MTVRLVKRGGIYHAVISYKNEFGKWCQKSESTGYKIKNNKKNAEKRAQKILHKFEMEYSNRNLNISSNILFSDFMKTWLEMKKNNVRPNTLQAYTLNVNTHIIPYFEERKIRLCDLNQRDIQAFMNKKLEKVSPNTVLKYHQHIHSALKYAVRLDLVNFNVAERVELPKKVKRNYVYYNSDELNQLLKVAKGTPIESVVTLAVFYGLRRQEALGLKYSAVDFDNNIIYINHTVVLVGSKANYVDDTKTSSSNRALPLIPEVKKYLLELKQKQEKDKLIFGNCYKDLDYICRRENGDLLDPNYISHYFKRMLEQNNLRHIRFHDLRHSSGSLLKSAGCDLKDIQEWLGHSNISTTADIYTHLDFESKIEASNKIQSNLRLSS